MELRERVALDLVNSDRAMAGLPPVGTRLVIPNSDGYLVNADAAIAAVLDAMREPSEAMLDRFVSRALCVSIHGEGGWSEYGRNQWKAMLDGFRQDHALPPDSRGGK